ncbi:hypothetical protein CBW46_006480 [Paenibacillus xerothermodurans]|uniref:Uncharacterized protein n=1 Tax=Paenibacillus xerothermodurans TaxID=1977292 RepID=A0A2W1P4G9_PAEXE|nr:hypothetical protein CBW46_006480 [Paenibacillus xerothermodurans]
MDMKKRLSILRKHETECYSVCLYLLQCERMACEAAKDALWHLMRCDSFFAAERSAQKQLLREESMRSALEQRKKLVCTR